MKRILWLFLALLALLLAACGSGDEESTSELERDGLAGQAPPVATSTPAATAEAPVGDLSDRLDEMTLDEDDAPRGLAKIGSMTLDYDMDNLGLGSGSAKAHMTMFAGPGQREMAVSMVMLLDDPSAVEQALGAWSPLRAVTLDQIEDGLGMPGPFGVLDYENLRELDVEGLGEGAFGFAMKFELPQMGEGDGQWVFFGRGSVLGMAMTMAMSGGAATDAVPLAEVMDAKIKDVLLH